MRAIAAIVCSSAAVSTASAGLLASSAMIDDFSGPSSAGLGFTRTNQGAASVSGGQGFLTAGAGGFQYLSDSPGFVASAYSGISLKVSGNLGDGALELNAIGGDMNFVAMGIDLGAYLSNGYVWVTFDQMDAAVGNDPGTIASAMSEGFGFWGIGLTLTGTTGSVQIDDFEFRTSAVPAPGALALLGVAGLAGGRRRR